MGTRWLATKYLLDLDFSYYIENTLPINILELLAAIIGTYYILNKKRVQKPAKYFVFFLWVTVFIEIIGSYTPIAYYSNYEYFSFVKDTKFVRNNWLYNPYLIVSYAFYPLYFRFYIRKKKWRRILKFLIVFFIVSAIVNLIISDVYFQNFSQYTMMIGAFLIFVSVGMFYFELLRSEAQLNLKKFLPFYVSIGTFFFHMCMTPIGLYSKYFSADNIAFVDFRVKTLLISNILMYLIYITGFIVCKRRNSY